MTRPVPGIGATTPQPEEEVRRRGFGAAFDAANDWCGRYFLPLVWLITAVGFFFLYLALYLRVG